MNKKRKISLLLTIIGVLMIGSACLLEYIIFTEKPVVETRHHEKITLKDMMDAREKTSEDESKKTEKEQVVQEVLAMNEKETVTEKAPVVQEEVQDVYLEVLQPVVYENMTLEELGQKLNRSLNSTISGYGFLIASKATELGIDPYLAVAIMLHETGCKWNCSRLVQSCNNVGGQKGSPSCNGSSYKAYATLEEGITGYMENLYTNYYAKGLTTAETIAQKYVGTTGWSDWIQKVNSYIESIRAA